MTRRSVGRITGSERPRVPPLPARERSSAQGPDHDPEHPSAPVAAKAPLEIDDELATLGLAVRDDEQQVAAPEARNALDDLEDPETARPAGSAYLFHRESGH